MKIIEHERGIKSFKDVVSLEIPIPKKNPDGSFAYENKDIEVCSVSIVALEKSNKIPYHNHLLTHSIYQSIEGEGVLYAKGKKIILGFDVYIPPNVDHTIEGDIIFLCVEIPPDDEDFKVYKIIESEY